MRDAGGGKAGGGANTREVLVGRPRGEARGEEEGEGKMRGYKEGRERWEQMGMRNREGEEGHAGTAAINTLVSVANTTSCLSMGTSVSSVCWAQTHHCGAHGSGWCPGKDSTVNDLRQHHAADPVNHQLHVC